MEILNKNTTIALASDHAGFTLKELVKKELLAINIEVKDFGCFSDSSVDYPDFARPASTAVANNEYSRGILICGSGTGMSISANKIKGVRAANCWNKEITELARLHNNINVLCLGARMIEPALAFQLIETFLNTEFEGGRHSRRVDKFE